MDSFIVEVVTWNESGEPIRALGVYMDNQSDRKRAEAALQASEAEPERFQFDHFVHLHC